MSTANKLFENTEIPDCNAYQARYVLYLGISCKTIFVNFQSVMANSLFLCSEFQHDDSQLGSRIRQDERVYGQCENSIRIDHPKQLQSAAGTNTAKFWNVSIFEY